VCRRYRRCVEDLVAIDVPQFTQHDSAVGVYRRTMCPSVTKEAASAGGRCGRSPQVRQLQVNTPDKFLGTHTAVSGFTDGSEAKMKDGRAS